MLQSTLCFVFNQQGDILLCKKKRGFGIGKWNGAGGKQVDGETIEQTAIREFHEETGITINDNDLVKKGVLHFLWDTKPDWNQSVHVYLGKGFIGEPMEGEEMIPQWWNIHELPYENMWEDDQIWLPRYIAGEEFEYEFKFNEHGNIYNSNEIK